MTAIAPSSLVAVGTGVIAAAPATVAPPSPTLDVRSQVSAAAPPANSGVVGVRASATAGPPPTLARQFTIAPTPAPTATVHTAVTVIVQGSGREGTRLRPEPVGGETLVVLTNGTRLMALGDATSAGGRSWQKMRTADAREGWIAADLVVTDGG